MMTDPTTADGTAGQDGRQDAERVTVRVMLLFGDQAELVTPEHDHRDPLRVPAAVIAGDAGLPANELPGRRFTAERAGAGFRDFRLVDDPRL